MLARTPRDIGLLIRAQRKKLGLDQAALALRVGVSRQWIVEVEKGKPRAELGLILRTLNALDLSLDVSAADPRSPDVSDDDPADLDAVIARAHGRRK